MYKPAFRAALVVLLTFAGSIHAQNPVVAASREIFDGKAKNMVLAAEEMSADKYTFQPTPGQWTFGKIVAHVVDGNSKVCAMIRSQPGGQPGDSPAGVKETDSKEALVTALKSSFAFCAKTLDAATDASLADPIAFFGGRKTTRARALLELDIDVTDHYSQMASYLRLTGLLPPSAQPKK